MALRARRLLALALAGAMVPALTATAAPQPGLAPAASPQPGAPGLGDPYYPSYGNGGYNVSAYDIRVRYRPSSDRLTGTTTITGRASSALSRFNLDFVLKASSVTVNGRKARFSQSDPHELVVTPALDPGPGREDEGSGPLRRRPVQGPGAGGQPLGPRGRGRGRGQRAGDRTVVVPEQRPPAGQGDVRHRRNRAPRGGGDQQRPPAQQAPAAGPPPPGPGGSTSRWPPIWPTSSPASTPSPRAGPTGAGTSTPCRAAAAP